MGIRRRHDLRLLKNNQLVYSEGRSQTYLSSRALGWRLPVLIGNFNPIALKIGHMNKAPERPDNHVISTPVHRV